LHAAAKGTQNYACTAGGAADGGASYAWALKGPEAMLNDCNGAPIGHHFASDAGTPEWQLNDGTFAVAHKKAAFAVDGGAVPWLLLAVDARGGTAPLAQAQFVQRVNTRGGVAPGGGCDATRAASGGLEKVPYEADYFFFGP
jgi:hypothetical protein